VLLTLVILSLVGLLAWQAHLNQVSHERLLRLMSLNSGLSLPGTASFAPPPPVPVEPHKPREVAKRSFPVPLGAYPRPVMGIHKAGDK
jgi:hypothetical protein